jgi:hypothetical protein
MKIPEDYELLITVKNQITLERIYVPRITLLAIALQEICNHDENTTDIRLVNYRRYVTGEFVKGYVDKNFKDLKIPRYWTSQTRKWVQLEARLWGVSWRLIKLLSYTALETSAETFKNLIYECKLLCFIQVIDETTTTEYIRKLQNENRQLQSLNNPYNLSSSYTTWQFINRAIQEANTNPDFYKDYQQVVRVRMEFVSYIKSQRPKQIDRSGNHEHRGFKAK